MNTKRKISKISRREFNTKLTAGGTGLIATGIFSSFAQNAKAGVSQQKFIDVHHHLGSGFIADSDHFSFEPMIKWMDDHSVTQTIMLSPILYPDNFFPGREDAVIQNDALLDKFEETDGRIVPFCVVHPEAFTEHKEIVKVLKRFKQKGVKGLGELKPKDPAGNPRNMSVDDPAMQRIYAACAEVDFPVLIHIDNEHAVDVPGLPGLEKMLKQFSDVNFIGHANGWWNSITGDVKEFKGYPKGKITPGGAAVRLLEEYPNMYGDLSANSGLNAVTRDPEFGLKFLVDFSDKLLFGTDTPGAKGGDAHFSFYNEADLPQEVKQKICSENTRRLFKL